MPANHSLTNRVMKILIHSQTDNLETDFQYISLGRVAKNVISSCSQGINAIILIPRIFEDIANENGHYIPSELE